MRRAFMLCLLLCLLTAPVCAEIVGRTQEDYIHRHIAENGQEIYFLSIEEDPLVYAEDVNFDGSHDLVVCTAQGASNAAYEFFLFDGSYYTLADRPSSMDLINYALHPDCGLVSTYANNGYAGLLYESALLRWEGTRLIEVRRAVSSHAESEIDDGDMHIRMEDYGRIALSVTEPTYDSEGYRDGNSMLFSHEAAHEEIIGYEQALLEAAHAALWDGL